MADYGFKTLNDDGGIQIDSIYRNFSLDQTGTKTISNGNDISNWFTTISITSSPLHPLIAIKPNTDDFVSLVKIKKSGSNFIGFDLTTKYSQSTSISWASFRENISSSDEDYALRIYNPGGDLCFDSGKSYLKIKQIELISISPTGYTDISHSSYSNPYYIFTGSSFWHNVVDGGDGNDYTRFYTIGIKKLSSTSVRVGWFAMSSTIYPLGAGDPIVEGYYGYQNLLICEV